MHQTYSDSSGCGGGWVDDLAEAIADAEQYAKKFNIPRRRDLENGKRLFCARKETPPRKPPPILPGKRQPRTTYFISPNAYRYPGFDMVVVDDEGEEITLPASMGSK